MTTAVGDAFGASRLSIVGHDTRHATTQHKAMQFASRSAVAKRSSSIRHRVFRVRKKVSIFQRRAYQSRWSRCRPPETESRCAKVVVLTATQRRARKRCPGPTLLHPSRAARFCTSHSGECVSQSALQIRFPVSLRRRPSDFGIDPMVSPTLCPTLSTALKSKFFPPLTVIAAGIGQMMINCALWRKALSATARRQPQRGGMAFAGRC